jgi:hypothetical protein
MGLLSKGIKSIGKKIANKGLLGNIKKLTPKPMEPMKPRKPMMPKLGRPQKSGLKETPMGGGRIRGGMGMFADGGGVIAGSTQNRRAMQGAVVAKSGVKKMMGGGMAKSGVKKLGRGGKLKK